MRIILDLDKHRDERDGKRKVRLRVKYYTSSGDDLRVHNCGVEIYNLLMEGFEHSFSGGIIVFEGEKR